MFNKSETIAELFKSLSKAQAQMEHAKKDSLNPHFKSKYADLSDVWEAVRKPLTDNGLMVTQTIDFDETGNQWLLTILGHTSGEWIASRFKLFLDRTTSQGQGSALTYARRYSLAAICGISQDDDDGEEAESAHRKMNSSNPNSFVTTHTPKPQASGLVSSGANRKPTEAQLKRLFAISTQAGFTTDDIKNTLKSMFNVESSKELNMDQYNQYCDGILQDKRPVQSPNQSTADFEQF